MLIVVDGSGNSRIVVVPFSSSDAAVSVFISKVGKELQEHLVLSHLSADDFGVEAAVVDTLEVGGVDESVTVLVELEEGLVSDCLALCVQLALHMKDTDI